MRLAQSDDRRCTRLVLRIVAGRTLHSRAARTAQDACKFIEAIEFGPNQAVSIHAHPMR